ncbi:MAG: hypothetical protein RLP02_12990, partial [Coleofasciculus sp. C2-GNP5-27]
RTNNILHRVSASGFFATKNELIEHLNGQLDSQNWYQLPTFKFYDGKLAFETTISSSEGWSHGGYMYAIKTTYGPKTEVGGINTVPEFDFGSGGDFPYYNTPVAGASDETDLGSQVSAVQQFPSNGETYTFFTKNEEPFPSIFHVNQSYGSTRGESGVSGSNPKDKFYLNAEVMPALFTSVALRNTETGDTYPPVRGSSVTLDQTEKSIRGRFNGPGLPAVITNEDLVFELGMELAQSASFGGMMERFTDISKEYANQGVMPLITTNDVDLSDINTSLSSSQVGPYALERTWRFFGTGKSFDEIIAEECKLLGCIPTITGDGKFSIRPLRFVSITALTASTADASNVNTRRFPTFLKSKERLLNHSILYTDYDWEEDEYRNQIHARYLESLAFTKKDRKYEIKPYSTPVHSITADETERILLKPLNLFGAPMSEISIDVPITLLSVAIGDAVSLTNIQLPNRLTSTRGVNNLACLCIGVNWNLGTGKGTLKLITPDVVYRGYTPTLEATEPGVAGDVYTFPVSERAYAPLGTSDLSFFKPDMRVAIHETDTWTESATSGTVVSVNEGTNEIAIMLTASKPYPTFGDTTIQFTPRTDIDLTDLQKDYVHIASGSVSGSGYQDGLSYFGA